MNRKFKNQVGIITGAASGIGSAIAIRLSEMGVKVILFDHDLSKLSKIESLIQNDYVVHNVDVTDEKEVAKRIDLVGNQFGEINILVNSAGITGVTNINSHQVNSDDIRHVLEVNFLGSFFMSKHV